MIATILKVIISRYVCLAGLLSILAMLPGVALAERNMGRFPFVESFDDERYVEDLLYVSWKMGASHVWERTGGWRGGAAKFIPPTDNEGYSGLGQFTRMEKTNGNIDQLNIRFLILHGSSFAERAPRGKLIITNRLQEEGKKILRPMVFLYSSRRGRYYAPCHGTWCDGPARDQQPFYIDDYLEQWVSLEMEVKLKQQEINLYVHTPDGKVAGLVAQNRFVDPNDPRPLTKYPFVFIDGIGFYWGRPGQVSPLPYDENTYLKIDELQIGNRYIGPPEGFLKKTAAAKTPATASEDRRRPAPPMIEKR